MSVAQSPRCVAALVFVLLLLACAARRKQGKDPPSAVSKGSREPSASLASKLTDRKGELTEQRGAVGATVATNAVRLGCRVCRTKGALAVCG